MSTETSLQKPETEPAPPPKKGGPKSWLLGLVYYAGLLLLPFALGGVLHLSVFETPSLQTLDDRRELLAAIGLLSLAALMVLLPGVPLFLSQRKRMIFGTIWCWFLLIAVMFLGELVLRTKTPAWPVVGLHGVPVEVAREAWAHQEADPGGLNSWGQRDKDRSPEKPRGTFRIALIGDSFLEESTSIPLSRLVEEKLGRRDVEVLNLGVSATEPDEYFYRAKNLAISLEIDHCVLCIYSGNDFVAPARTLETTAGIAAVYPRGSLLSSLGLYSWNHLLTNRQRPVVKTWLSAGNMLEAETNLGRSIAEADEQGLRNLLYSIDHAERSAAQLKNLARQLNSPEMSSFFQMIRQPDKGLFRSYYLNYGLWSASVGGGQWEPLSEENAYHWVREAEKACRAKGVGLTLVIIPEAFQVDPRMADAWKPLTDMRELLAPCRIAARKLRERAEKDGIATIDLHDDFEGVPGTYLNLDGHWSDQGVDLAAQVISQRLAEAVVPESP